MNESYNEMNDCNCDDKKRMNGGISKNVHDNYVQNKNGNLFIVHEKIFNNKHDNNQVKNNNETVYTMHDKMSNNVCENHIQKDLSEKNC